MVPEEQWLSMSDRIQILHVDDEEDFLEITQTFLGRLNESFEVETITSVPDAIEQIEIISYDCIISDYDMPTMSGLSFLEAVRKRDPDVPFILFTGKGSEEVASQAISEGVTDYLQKETGSEQFEVLANRIENIVDQYRAERRAEQQERLLTILRDVNQALVSATSVEEIEHRITEIIADASPYRFAWFGRYDKEHSRIVPKAIYGDTDLQFQPIRITSPDSDDLLSALDERDIKVVGEPSGILKRIEETAGTIDCQSLVVVPLDYQQETHGFIVAYTSDPELFDISEMSMLDEVAGDIAQALHAVTVRRELRKHETAVEAVPTGVFLLDEGATIDFVNERGAVLFGYEPAELIGESFQLLIDQGLVDADIIEWYVASLRELLSSSNPKNEAVTERTVNPEDGDPRKVEVHIRLRPFKDEFRGTVGVLRDVTERRAYEDIIKKIHAQATGLSECTTREEVYEKTLTAAEDLLAFDQAVISIESQDFLRVEATTEGVPIEDGTGFSIDEGVAGKTYRNQKSYLHNDAASVADAKPQTEVGSALSIPIGQWGVFQVIDQEPYSFDESDLELAQLLIRHTENMLSLLDREIEIENERDRFKALFENFPEPTLSYEFIDGKPYIKTVNEAFEQVFAWDEPTVSGKPVDDLLVPEDKQEEAEAIDAEVKAGKFVDTELKRRTATGERWFWFRNINMPASDRVDGYAIYTDITDRKQHQEALERERDRLSSLIEAIPEPIVLEVKRDGVPIIDRVNPAFEEIFGIDESIAMGRSLNELIVPEDKLTKAIEADERVMAGEDVSIETKRLTNEGLRDFILRSVPFGKVDAELERGSFTLYTDITERKQREATIQNERDLLAALFQAVPEPLIHVEHEGNDLLIRRVNDAFEEVFGFSEAEISGEMLDKFIVPPDELDVAAEINRKAIAGEQYVREVKRRTANGLRSFLLSTAQVGRRAGRVESVGTYVDITEQKQQAAELESQRQKIKGLYEAAIEIGASDVAEIVYEQIIHAAETILDYDLARVAVIEEDSLQTAITSRDLEQATDTAHPPIEGDGSVAAQVYRTGEAILIDDLRQSNQTSIEGPYLSAITVPIGDHGVFQAISEEIDAFSEDDLELVELFTAHAAEVLTRIDQTSKLEQRSEEIRRQNDRLERFASIVSHDLRNPLMVASGHIELAKDEVEHEMLEEVERAHNRMDAIIDNLLDFAKTGHDSVDLERVQLKESIKNCWTSVGSRTADLTVDIDHDIQADSELIKHLLENLLVNAVDHGGQEVSIHCGALEDGFFIEDDGPGIPPDEQASIFEPGFSTEPDGNGFGLAIVAEIVEAHGWAIEVTDAEHSGARFEICRVTIVD